MDRIALSAPFAFYFLGFALIIFVIIQAFEFLKKDL